MFLPSSELDLSKKLASKDFFSFEEFDIESCFYDMSYSHQILVNKIIIEKNSIESIPVSAP